MLQLFHTMSFETQLWDGQSNAHIAEMNFDRQTNHVRREYLKLKAAKSLMICKSGVYIAPLIMISGNNFYV